MFVEVEVLLVRNKTLLLFQTFNHTEPTHHMVAGTHLPSPTPYRVIIYKSMLYGMKINEMHPLRDIVQYRYRTFSSRPAGRVSAWDRIPLQKYYDTIVVMI